MRITFMGFRASASIRSRGLRERQLAPRVVCWVGIWSLIFAFRRRKRRTYGGRYVPPLQVWSLWMIAAVWFLAVVVAVVVAVAVGAAGGCGLAFAHFIGCWILAVCIATPINSWKSGVPATVRVSRETGQALAS